MAAPSHPKIRPWLASFGRRRGRRLPDEKQELLDTLLPKLQPSVEEVKAAPAVWFELGFGGGEHLAEQAANHPEVLCIGCEPYHDGVARLLMEVRDRGLQNVRILADDARLLLEKLPEASLDRVFILFPDPWPKLKHHKRRIVSQATLTMFARVIKPGGELRLATDHVDYSQWMLEQGLAHPDFEWTAKTQKDWKEAPPDWVPTRYEQKTRKEGRVPVYYLFIRLP